MVRFRCALVVATLAAVLTGGAAAGAPAVVPAPTAPSLSAPGPPPAPTDGGAFSSDNVEWLGSIPLHSGSSGGNLVGKHYYLTDPRGLYIYDVSDPAAPQLVGELPAVQNTTHIVFAQEDPDTNGKILLVNGFHPDGLSTNPNGSLLVIDVSDKTAPRVVGFLDVYDHTWTCILDCKFAIGRTGHVVDLTDPTKPERIGDWRLHVFEPGYMHDFVEVAPGRVIGAGQPSLYLDLTNPRRPKELGRIDPGFHALGYHGAAWPNRAKDPLLLMGAEVEPEGAGPMGSDCADDSVHAVATYDASDVIKVDRKQFGPGGGEDSAGIRRQRARAQFRKLHEWRVAGRGVYADGNAPAHTLYCGHWFDPHPDWRAGGLLALGHYDWGTRFLDVRRDGSMQEVGWFQPLQGYTSGAKWIGDEIVYVHDYRRGLEILRFTRE